MNIPAAGKLLRPATLLQKCTTMKQLKQIHGHLITTALLLQDVRLLGRLFAFAAVSDSGDLDYAQLLFTQIQNPNIFFWNTLIRAYSNSPTPQKSIFLYTQILRASLLPDIYTFPFLLKSCSQIPDPQQGKTVHGQTVKLGLESYVFVQNALINFYSTIGNIDVARQLFDENPQLDVVSWNSIISGYARLGDMGSARTLFDQMAKKNAVSWTALISGYVQAGLSKEALALFSQMQASQVKAHEATLVSVLSACAHLGALEQGKWVHSYLKSNDIKLSVYLGTSLVDMYAKCGNIALALEVFYQMDVKNVLVWTTMIKGLAMHGRGEAALDLFSKMQEAGIEPDDITFIGVLCACTHSGLVEEGRRFFDSMTRTYNVTPKIEHYGCMVDLFARGGLLDEARYMIDSMPMEPDVLVWGALMAGCRFHGNVELAEYVAKHLIRLEPSNGAVYVLLSNIYAASGRHMEARKVRQLMKTKGVIKTPGCSLVEVKGAIHQFLVGDTSHPQIRAIQVMWEEIERLIKLQGYIPNKTQVFFDIEEEEKEEALAHHSEKLAIAFGLLSTTVDTVLHIVKNLRVCSDCHEVTKLISKVYGREIVVRDRTRFHCFKEGSCSCKDYW